MHQQSKSSPKSEFHRSCKLTDQPIFNRRMKEENSNQAEPFSNPEMKALRIEQRIIFEIRRSIALQYESEHLRKNTKRTPYRKYSEKTKTLR